MRKPEAAKLVMAGYGYRFCIADDMPPPQKAQWEAWLLDEARKIVTNPSPPQVVTATDLATWANQYSQPRPSVGDALYPRGVYA